MIYVYRGGLGLAAIIIRSVETTNKFPYCLHTTMTDIRWSIFLSLSFSHLRDINFSYLSPSSPSIICYIFIFYTSNHNFPFILFRPRDFSLLLFYLYSCLPCHYRLLSTRIQIISIYSLSFSRQWSLLLNFLLYIYS